MVTATKPAPRPMPFEFDRIVRARDIADERISMADREGDVKWWARLREAMEAMIAGEMPEDELGDWLEEFGLESEVLR
jgi:hypothetical protein